MGNLTLEGRIVVFKALTISKMVFLALLTKILYPEVKELEKIRKTFLWKNAAPKIKHETTCKDCKDVGLKNFDRSCKIVSLQCSWIKTLYNEYFHAWKLIPLHLVTMSFGSTLKFHSNIKKKKHYLKNFYRSTEIFVLIGGHNFRHVLKPQVAFFRSFYGLTSIFK